MQKLAPHLNTVILEQKFECIFCGKMLLFGNLTCHHCDRPAPGWNGRMIYWKISSVLAGVIACGIWGLGSLLLN